MVWLIGHSLSLADLVETRQTSFKGNSAPNGGAMAVYATTSLTIDT